MKYTRNKTDDGYTLTSEDGRAVITRTTILSGSLKGLRQYSATFDDVPVDLANGSTSQYLGSVKAWIAELVSGVRTL